jgi:hypothetical protein
MNRHSWTRETRHDKLVICASRRSKSSIRGCGAAIVFLFSRTGTGRQTKSCRARPSTISNPSFGQHPSFVHSKYPTHFCVASSHIWKMGPSASIDDICNIFEVEKDVLKVVSKCLSVTLAELCRVGDDSEMGSLSARGNCIRVCPGTTSSCTSWTSDSDWEHRRAIPGMC